MKTLISKLEKLCFLTIMNYNNNGQYASSYLSSKRIFIAYQQPPSTELQRRLMTSYNLTPCRPFFRLLSALFHFLFLILFFFIFFSFREYSLWNASFCLWRVNEELYSNGLKHVWSTLLNSIVPPHSWH